MTLAFWSPFPTNTRRPGRDKLRAKHLWGNRKARDKILAIRVDGIIVGEPIEGGIAGMLSRQVSGYAVQQTLRSAANDPRIKGVVVQFSTPGGQLHGARAIFDGIRGYSAETSNPIIAHVEGLSASAGVYAMVGADSVFAEPGSMTGSVGVTLGTHQWYDDPVSVMPSMLSGGVDTRKGVHSYTLAAGKSKDLLSPWREPTDDELATITRQLQPLYKGFVEHVSTNRKIAADTLEEIGSFVFTNSEASMLGFIDGEKTRQQAFDYVAERAGLDTYNVVGSKRRRGILSRLAGSVNEEAGPGAMYGVSALAPSAYWQGWRP